MDPVAMLAVIREKAATRGWRRLSRIEKMCWCIDQLGCAEPPEDAVLDKALRWLGRPELADALPAGRAVVLAEAAQLRRRLHAYLREIYS